MDESDLYVSRRKKARLAGIGYLVLALAALPDALRARLFVMDDAAATGQNILSNAMMLRLSVLGDIVTEIAFLCIGLCLYSLLREVKQGAARAMLAMVAMAVTMTIFNTGTEIAAMSRFEANDPAYGMLLLKLFDAFKAPTSIFYGLWMLPLGYLFFASGFMPKTLGILLMIGSSGYVIHAVFRIAAPRVSERAVLLSVIAEVATIVWLLAFGVKGTIAKPAPIQRTKRG